MLEAQEGLTAGCILSDVLVRQGSDTGCSRHGFGAEYVDHTTSASEPKARCLRQWGYSIVATAHLRTGGGRLYGPLRAHVSGVHSVPTPLGRHLRGMLAQSKRSRVEGSSPMVVKAGLQILTFECYC